ncbi:MAG: nucleoside triphosphate pyrophosphohydrolase [Calditrichaceae bacterium]|nr:nucleoside triphosphate pyrophosphohydrolase [Calditrichaceae bacterium]MBN2708296.1 nucleoside triphosphate pyrophosphohydrolase [Calditrichaceae bacterium]RQV91938.1 MAG: nucleoside triphosphate pyrophosphohydrolase [Calditrichota bacterium]
MEKLLKIMHRLRRECPWDAKQTHQSLKPYLLEETYEALESIDEENWDELASELGDLLLQIIFHSEIASEKGCFNYDTVLEKISKKLIERHPHVFDKEIVKNAEDVQRNWEHIKVKSEKRDSLLTGVPATSPALLQAQRLQEKAASVGFDWDSIHPVMEKLEEEWNELKEAAETGSLEKIKNEYGDILFTLVNLARFLHIESEDSLRLTNKKFIKRFNYIEKKYDNDLNAMKSAGLKEMDRLWEEAKNKE